MSCTSSCLSFVPVPGSAAAALYTFSQSINSRRANSAYLFSAEGSVPPLQALGDAPSASCWPLACIWRRRAHRHRHQHRRHAVRRPQRAASATSWSLVMCGRRRGRSGPSGADTDCVRIPRARRRSRGPWGWVEFMVGSGSAGTRGSHCIGREPHASRAAHHVRKLPPSMFLVDVRLRDDENCSYLCLCVASGHRYSRYEVLYQHARVTGTSYGRAQSRSGEGAVPPLPVGTKEIDG